jgi:hypothetical protein
MHRLNQLPKQGGRFVESQVETATTERGTDLRKFTDVDVELSLRLLALNGGAISETVAQLAQPPHNTHVDAATLRRWRKTLFPNRYLKIQNEFRKELGESLSNQLIENATQSAELTTTIIAELDGKVNDLEAKDLSRVAKDLADVSAKSVDKAMVLRGQPNAITEERNPELIVRELQRLGVNPRAIQVTNEAEAETEEVAD